MLINDSNAAPIIKPITLIGMMGSGKTYFGRRIAKALGLPFYDSDVLIEQKAGCSVAQIFERWGESKFREVEAKTIAETLEGDVCVLATGGGAIMNPDTAAQIFNRSIAVWVRADMDDILKRVAKNANRPLLACENPRDVIEKLMHTRQPVYEQAPLQLYSSGRKYSDVLQDILRAIHQENENVR
jgi:shikimate kinase